LKKLRHFIALLLFLPVFSHAQDSLEFDQLPDTAATVKPVDSDEYEDEVKDEQVTAKNKSVFSPVWMSSADSLHLRQVNAGTFKKQQEDEAFWYANRSFKKEQPKVKEPAKYRRPLIAHPAFETVLWILVIGGFVTFLVIFLMNSNVGIFRRSRSIAVPETTADFDDIFSINYQQEIDRATAAGNYNLAVRLHFLRLLRGLSDRQIIDYQQDRTNFDYMMQLRQSKYYSDFFRVTRHYEYAWYGQFPLEEEQYRMIRQQFETFERNLN
jgi:hypothetical protein